MWIKLLLCGLMIAFCTALGYLAAEKYRSRKKFFSQFELFNARYLTELAYARKPLEVFLREYSYTGDFQKLISALQKRGELPAHGFLTKEEQGDTENYFSMLGKGDTASQEAYFSSKKGWLAEKKKKAEEEAKARGELYVKLGLLAGLAFVILIV